MTKEIFNRYGDGGEEITKALGLITSGVTFDKWEPLLSFGMREVCMIIGDTPIEAICRYYLTEEIPDGVEDREWMAEAVKYLQKCVAYFTWIRIIPTLDAQHDENGRSRRLGENEKGLTALQEWKDEENIKRLAYEAAEDLLEHLEHGGYPFWTDSARYKMRRSLLIHNREEFDRYYYIGSHRLYHTMVPIICEVQNAQIAPVTGVKRMDLLTASDLQTEQKIGELCRRALALLTIKKAIERLPVEVIPEGVVQIQQSAPVNSRLKAEQSARREVTATLQADADNILRQISAIVAEMDADTCDAEDVGIFGPIAHSKGFSF